MPSMGGSSSNQSDSAAGGRGGRIGELFKSPILTLMRSCNQNYMNSKHPIKRIDWALLSAICLFTSNSASKPDISKYKQLLDSTANTLKFR